MHFLYLLFPEVPFPYNEPWIDPPSNI
jgi:hypothetical protein